MQVIIAFDLVDASSEDYELAYEMLASIGLHPVTPRKSVELPYTTVMGNLQGVAPMANVRDIIWEHFKKSGLRPSRLFGGVIQDWAARSAE